MDMRQSTVETLMTAGVHLSVPRPPQTRRSACPIPPSVLVPPRNRQREALPCTNAFSRCLRFSLEMSTHPLFSVSAKSRARSAGPPAAAPECMTLSHLGDLTPATARISHRLQPLFLCRTPWRIRPTLLGGLRRGRGLDRCSDHFAQVAGVGIRG